MKQDKDAISWLYGIENKKSILDQIKEKYDLLEFKKTFISDLADHLKKQPRSIQTNWFNGFWSIPERYQLEVLDYLTNYLNSKK